MTTFTTEDRQRAQIDDCSGEPVPFAGWIQEDLFETKATFDEMEFERIAHQYRAWPGFDPVGVIHRYEELLSYVKGLIK